MMIGKLSNEYEFIFSVNDSSYLAQLHKGMEYGRAAFRLEN
ncbi:MAG: hypothetical protein ACOVQA_04145 [Thermoflexibacteraceae bacterium]